MTAGRPSAKARRFTSAHAISLLAIFVALGGAAYAASRIKGASIRKGSIPANRFKKNSLTGAQVKEESLGTVPSAERAEQAASVESATNATNATSAISAVDARALDGIPAAGYQQGCKSGAIKGFVKVSTAKMESTYKAFPGYNCSGGEIQVRKAGFGEYNVRFLGTTSGTALGGSPSAAVKVSVQLAPDILVKPEKVFNVQTSAAITGNPLDGVDLVVLAF